MIHEIPYTGYTTDPSDYDCADGQMALSYNLISEDSQLKAINLPTHIFTPGRGCKVLYLHKSTSYTHYIIYDTDKGILSYTDTTVQGSAKMICYIQGVDKVTSIGNVLVISNTDGVKYYIYKTGTYKYMSDGIPSIQLLFSLNGESRAESYTDTGIQVKHKEETTTETEETLIFEQEIKAHYDGEATYVDVSIKSGDIYRFYKPYNSASSGAYDVYYVGDDGTETLWFKEVAAQSKRTIRAGNSCSRIKIILYFFPNAGITYTSDTFQIFQKQVIINPATTYIEKSLDNFNGIMATCNRFIASCHGQDKFIYPFYIRYALVLYDGSEAQVSAPILMMPNYRKVPFLPFSLKYSGDDVIVYAYAIACSIRMHIIDNNIEDWRDIISGINIYATAPLYTYNQAATYNEWSDNITIGKTTDMDGSRLYSVSSERGEFCGMSLTQRYSRFVGTLPENYIDIPLKSGTEINDNSNYIHTYYKIKSYTIDELIYWTSQGSEVQVDIELDKGTVNTISTRPALQGTDYVFNKMYPDCIFSYNNRLIIATSRERMFQGYGIQQLNGYYSEPTTSYWDDGYYIASIHINTGYGEAIVKTINLDRKYRTMPIHWFYYPNPNAFKAVITRLVYKDGKLCTYSQGEVTLKPHKFLPGAYWQDLDESVRMNPTDEAEYIPQPYTQPYSDPVNKIHVSEAGNPFVFNPANTFTVGTGDILGISSAAKALSQGQFGQFPLYAFTTDGVWALEVSSTGTFSARQPITRDVCTNPASITQLDDAVLFATDRGIMLLQGSQTTCITDTIATQQPYPLQQLPYISQLCNKAGQSSNILPGTPFLDYIKDCHILYDYTHQHIIIFNPTTSGGTQAYPYAYVYSLKSRQWGMMQSNLTSAINSYPDAMAMTTTGHLVTFSQQGNSSLGIYITRPLKLGAPDTYKTLTTIIQRGNFQRGDVSTALYASRDLINWYLIATSQDHTIRGIHGTPYKYFRIAAIASLAYGKSVSGASIQYNTRYNNKLR